MPGGEHYAVWDCENDQRYPEKQKILPHVGILRFYSPKNKKDVLSWASAINRDQFKYEGLFKSFCTRLNNLSVSYNNFVHARVWL